MAKSLKRAIILIIVLATYQETEPMKTIHYLRKEPCKRRTRQGTQAVSLALIVSRSCRKRRMYPITMTLSRYCLLTTEIHKSQPVRCCKIRVIHPHPLLWRCNRPRDCKFLVLVKLQVRALLECIWMLLELQRLRRKLQSSQLLKKLTVPSFKNEENYRESKKRSLPIGTRLNSNIYQTWSKPTKKQRCMSTELQASSTQQKQSNLQMSKQNSSKWSQNNRCSGKEEKNWHRLLHRHP